MRRRTDRLFRLHVDRLGPREREALERIEACPGITVEQLADDMGVTVKRIWHYPDRLEVGRVQREGDPLRRPSALRAPGYSRE